LGPDLLDGLATVERFFIAHLVPWVESNVPVASSELRMANEIPADEVLFEVETPLGFAVRVTKAAWTLITTVKHPVMAGREDSVLKTLESPDEIRASRLDTSVY
jgi:hypothetical protein